jgi:hypothetical protein
MPPFKVAPPIKCVKCDKSVYPNDKQVSYDGLVFHAQCSKCADCGSNVTVSNFAIADEDDGSKTLLCKVHYKARFDAAGGVYAGAGKFKKQSEREKVSKDASTRAGAAPVKASATNEKDTNYSLERSVTTPDRRPSIKEGMVPASAEETAKAPEIMARRASLKSTPNAAIKKEIEEEAARTAENTPGKSESSPAPTSVFAAVETLAAVETAVEGEKECCDKKGCTDCGCDACGTDACKCGESCDKAV